MRKNNLSLRKNLGKALDALTHEHAGEMMTPRAKRSVLANEEQVRVFSAKRIWLKIMHNIPGRELLSTKT